MLFSIFAIIIVVLHSRNQEEKVAYTFTPPLFTLSGVAYDSEISLSGIVAASQEVTVKAEVGGVVDGVQIYAGDSVQTGDVLVQLNADDESVLYTGAMGQLSALDSFYAAQQKASTNRIDVLSDAIDITRNQYDIILAQQKNLDVRLQAQEAEAAVARMTAVVSVEEIERQRAIALDALYGHVPDAVRASYIVSTDALNEMNKIFGIDGYSVYEYDFERYLGTLDSNTKNIAIEHVRKTNDLYDTFGSLYNTMTIDGDGYTRDQWDALLGETETLLLSVQESLKFTRFTLDATLSIFQDVEDMKSIIISQGAAVQGVLLSSENTGVRAVLLEKTRINETFDSQLRIAQTAVESANTRVETVFAASEIERTKLQGELDVLAKQISQAEQSFHMGEQEQVSALAQISVQIRQLEANARGTALRMDDARITAPFGGIVTERFVDQGDVVYPGMPIATLASEGQREVHMKVSDIISKQLHVGDVVTVKERNTSRRVDATISRIYPAVDTQNYTVAIEILLPSGISDTWLLGGIVSVVFTHISENVVNNTFRVPIEYVGFTPDGAALYDDHGQVYSVTVIEDIGSAYYIQASSLHDGITLVYPRY